MQADDKVVTCPCGMPELHHPRQYLIDNSGPYETAGLEVIDLEIKSCPGPRAVADVAHPAWTGYPLHPAAVGLPTDERALADRQQTGCLLRRGELCPCPAPPFAYDGCERIKGVGK